MIRMLYVVWGIFPEIIYCLDDRYITLLLERLFERGKLLE